MYRILSRSFQNEYYSTPHGDLFPLCEETKKKAAEDTTKITKWQPPSESDADEKDKSAIQLSMKPTLHSHSSAIEWAWRVGLLPIF
ncbi:hypothetical protein CEXT_255751 [Caerostris extrusa]|uniref:Uncharacterized protein n=1 Tax=Caerostris extrusa TaxID=172846 RepID=A0AAV4XIU1_CAEEX|nr:hypothetical protein CEXT_255751 [Caerostris extrusa]